MQVRTARAVITGAGIVGVVGALAGCAADDTGPHAYVDGRYVATGTYAAPSGPAGIGIVVEFEDDIVSNVEITPGAEVGVTKRFQERFAMAVHDEVLGKDVDDVEVSRLAGATLTSEAFNRAFETIKSDATSD